VGVEVDIERHRATTLICGAKNGKRRFKEWSLVCDALGRGRQIGNFAQSGIAEGAAAAFISTSRVLFVPTFFHEQIAKVRIAAADIPGTGQHHRNSVVRKGGAGSADLIHSQSQKLWLRCTSSQSKWCESVSATKGDA